MPSVMTLSVTSTRSALVEALHGGAISVHDAVEAAIARVERVNPELNALAFRAFDRARSEAREPRGGFFAGVPTLVKDNVDVAGMPTCQGTDTWAATRARSDGDFARMFLATGLIPLGKSQLSEYGFSATAEHPRLGPVRNPWTSTTPRAQLVGGSAALVAAGAVPIAHANDGGGSIRIPASVNGLVGLKPTRGRLAQDKMMRDMPIRIVSDGVVTRSVRDTAAFFREAEKVYRWLKLQPIGDITRPGRKRLKVAVHTQGVGRGADAEVTELTMKTARLLEELGHTVEEVAAPVPDVPRRLPSLLVDAGHVRAAHRPPLPRPQLRQEPARQPHARAGSARRPQRPSDPRRHPAAAAQHRPGAQFFQEYDVALAPTLAHETPRIGHLDPTQDYETIMDRLLDWVAFTPWQNASGEPAISLPLATTAGGLPMGMMFGAGAGREAMLLELAYELEEAAPFASITGTAPTTG